ncbi:hypothetical protein L916_11581 [Phytophthora nicotianae]|uniref:Uncharacterized protein n=1 Tax=Phytophthora nicotianae TaxID=4792 RepID=W2IQP1_PHYNI|nr:hypothetical protein L916_11581 [Phytophthora nicotianae]
MAFADPEPPDPAEVQDSDADNRDRADAAEDAESEVTSAVVWTWYEVRGKLASRTGKPN